MEGCEEELMGRVTPTSWKIQLTVEAEKSAQYKGVAGACRVASLVRRTAPARLSLREACSLRWLCAWGAVFRPQVSTELLAIYAPYYMAEGTEGDPEWPQEGPGSIPASNFVAGGLTVCDSAGPRWYTLTTRLGPSPYWGSMGISKMAAEAPHGSSQGLTVCIPIRVASMLILMSTLL